MDVACQVILVDRSLMPGDVVRRLILNEDSQRGYVKDMNVTCHLHILGTDKYIYNIDSKSLDPITVSKLFLTDFMEEGFVVKK